MGKIDERTGARNSYKGRTGIGTGKISDSANFTRLGPANPKNNRMILFHNDVLSTIEEEMSKIKGYSSAEIKSINFILRRLSHEIKSISDLGIHSYCRKSNKKVSNMEVFFRANELYDKAKNMQLRMIKASTQLPVAEA